MLGIARHDPGVASNDTSPGKRLRSDGIGTGTLVAVLCALCGNDADLGVLHHTQQRL